MPVITSETRATVHLRLSPCSVLYEQHTPLRMKPTSAIILFFGDMVMFVGGLFGALGLRYGTIPEAKVLREHLDAFFWIFILWGVVFLIAGLYDVGMNLSRKRIPELVLRSQLVNMALAAVVFFTLPIGLTPKLTLALYLMVSTALILFWRLFLFPLLMAQRSERVLIVGNSDEARELLQIFKEGPYYKLFEAQLIDTGQFATQVELEKTLRSHIETKGTTLFIADMFSNASKVFAPLYYQLAVSYGSLSFKSLPDVYEQMFYRVPFSNLNEGWLLEHTSQKSHIVYDSLKRVVDVLGSLILGVILFPVMALVALLVRLEDGGPALYKTVRTGKYNNPIRIIKFRSMTGMDKGKEALNSKHTVTRIGHIIRSVRLDELPQLWNVLRGDISFIGPRPEMPALAEVYEKEIPYYSLRHLITPGLSGWAQIYHDAHPHHGTDVTETKNKLSYDMYYLRHRSFLLDIEIALKTIKTLLSRSGV